MASLQEIESTLQAINEATFQELCDDYLFWSEEDYPELNRTGSQKGKKKTKKGTPDTFWLLPSGKYVFAEYTTKTKKGSKTAFLKKIKADIKSCLTPTITHIEVNKIRKIILCFNSEILPHEIESLKSLLTKARIELQIKSLDTIAIDIFGRFQHLALKHLGLHIDTGQVLRPEVFKEEYTAGASLSTPLDNKFYFRDDELSKIKSALESSDILVLTGPPGVGKSKLALAAMSDWVSTYPDYEIYCISNKHIQIYEDLKSYIKNGKNYVLLIDDANRQSQNLLQILSQSKNHKKGFLKIIITVRDYAFEFIKLKCNEFDFSVFAISGFTDEQLEEILKSDDFKVSNRIYLKRILEVAKGNPRVAIMAAKLAIKHQKIDVLHDLAEFYDTYFSSFISDNDVFNNQNILKALGLVSFFFSIDRSNKNFYEQLLSDFEISHYEFTEAVTYLERLELLESTSDNSIIRISDQVLSAYFFYKVFLKNKLLDFSILLHNYFESHSNRFRDTIIPANNDFGYEKVLKPIEQALSEYLGKVSADENKVFNFLDVFWFYLHEETLSFVYERIKQIPVAKSPVFIIDKKNRNISWDRNKNLELLSKFYYQSIHEITSAIEITFEYLSREPELYHEVFKKISDIFIFSYEDERLSFYRQSKLIDVLIGSGSKKDPVVQQIFFDLFPVLLQSHFTVHGSSWKRNTISFYQYNLPASDTVFGLRSKLWKHLDKIYALNKQKAAEAVYEYIQPSRDDVKEVLEKELPLLLKIIDRYFIESSFLDCYYVQKLITRYSKLDIVHPSFTRLKEKFYSKAYKIYKIVDGSRLRNKEDYEYENLDFKKFERLKEIEVRYNLRVSSILEFREVYKFFVEMSTTPHVESWSFNNSLDVLIHETYLTNKELALKCLLEIQKKDNKTFYYPIKIITAVAENSKLTDKFFSAIIKSGFSFQNRHGWVFIFAQILKAEFTKKEHYQEILATFNSVSVFAYFDFGFLEKFIKFDPAIYHSVLKIFINKVGKGINGRLDMHFFEKHLHHFVSDLSLPKEAYFICEKIEQHFDHDCKDFLAILKLDDNFLLEYLSFITKDKHYLSTRDYMNLSVIWQLKNAEKMVKSVFRFFNARKFYSSREHFANSFFTNLSSENKERAIKFLKSCQLTYAKNIRTSNLILDIYRHSLNDKYHFAIMEFLKLNNNFESFRKLELLASFFSSTGNTIWADVRAAELEQILALMNKLPKNYLYSQHKAYLKNWISAEKRSAERERKNQFMNNEW